MVFDNKKKLSRNLIASSKLIFLQKNNLIKLDSINIDKNKLNYKIKVSKKKCKLSKSSRLSNTIKELLKYILQIYNN